MVSFRNPFRLSSSQRWNGRSYHQIGSNDYGEAAQGEKKDGSWVCVPRRLFRLSTTGFILIFVVLVLVPLFITGAAIQVRNSRDLKGKINMSFC